VAGIKWVVIMWVGGFVGSRVWGVAWAYGWGNVVHVWLIFCKRRLGVWEKGDNTEVWGEC